MSIINGYGIKGFSMDDDRLKELGGGRCSQKYTISFPKVMFEYFQRQQE
ncbi:MAG: virulence RhuM family protein [Solobacterium sp.]|nr:virulence RhuM family protein [Solobacterium sp.]MCH4223146.1 virulence RhuM family protein [Solobacterium sp.]MCH4266545.1 virulence RhuM family protein [Solobacterium sp.]